MELKKSLEEKMKEFENLNKMLEKLKEFFPTSPNLMTQGE